MPMAGVCVQPRASFARRLQRIVGRDLPRELLMCLIWTDAHHRGRPKNKTVMVYAKLYPTTLIAEHRKAVRGLYNAFHGEDSPRNATVAEWSAFTAAIEAEARRDSMGVIGLRLTQHPRIGV
jgi:hypothetical protein